MDKHEESILVEGEELDEIMGQPYHYLQSVVYKNCKFTKPVVIENCIFTKEVSFSGCTFESSFKIDKCYFKSYFSLMGSPSCEFLDDVTIFNSKFDKEVTLQDCLFHKNISLQCEFNEGLSIFECTGKKSTLDLSYSFIQHNLNLNKLELDEIILCVAPKNNDDFFMQDIRKLAKKITIGNKDYQQNFPKEIVKQDNNYQERLKKSLDGIGEKEQIVDHLLQGTWDFIGETALQDAILLRQWLSNPKETNRINNVDKKIPNLQYIHEKIYYLLPSKDTNTWLSVITTILANWEENKDIVSKLCNRFIYLYTEPEDENNKLFRSIIRAADIKSPIESITRVKVNIWHVLVNGNIYEVEKIGNEYVVFLHTINIDKIASSCPYLFSMDAPASLPNNNDEWRQIFLDNSISLSQEIKVETIVGGHFVTDGLDQYFVLTFGKKWKVYLSSCWKNTADVWNQIYQGYDIELDENLKEILQIRPHYFFIEQNEELKEKRNLFMNSIFSGMFFRTPITETFSNLVPNIDFINKNSDTFWEIKKEMMAKYLGKPTQNSTENPAKKEFSLLYLERAWLDIKKSAKDLLKKRCENIDNPVEEEQIIKNWEKDLLPSYKDQQLSFLAYATEITASNDKDYRYFIAINPNHFINAALERVWLFLTYHRLTKNPVSQEDSNAICTLAVMAPLTLFSRYYFQRIVFFLKHYNELKLTNVSPSLNRLYNSMKEGNIPLDTKDSVIDLPIYRNLQAEYGISLLDRWSFSKGLNLLIPFIPEKGLDLSLSQILLEKKGLDKIIAWLDFLLKTDCSQEYISLTCSWLRNFFYHNNEEVIREDLLPKVEHFVMSMFESLLLSFPMVAFVYIRNLLKKSFTTRLPNSFCFNDPSFFNVFVSLVFHQTYVDKQYIHRTSNGLPMSLFCSHGSQFGHVMTAKNIYESLQIIQRQYCSLYETKSTTNAYYTTILGDVNVEDLTLNNFRANFTLFLGYIQLLNTKIHENSELSNAILLGDDAYYSLFINNCDFNNLDLYDFLSFIPCNISENYIDQFDMSFAFMGKGCKITRTLNYKRWKNINLFCAVVLEDLEISEISVSDFFNCNSISIVPTFPYQIKKDNCKIKNMEVNRWDWQNTTIYGNISFLLSKFCQVNVVERDICFGNFSFGYNTYQDDYNTETSYSQLTMENSDSEIIEDSKQNIKRILEQSGLEIGVVNLINRAINNQESANLKMKESI